MSETSGRDAATGSPPGPAPSGYAIAGQTPAAVLRPSGVAEVQAALREASASARAVIVQGGRTAIETGNPPDRYDVALDLTALDAVVAHEPDDFTTTVEAGMRFDALRALLAQHGQFLPLDPPHSRTATVGGVVARGRGGLRRGAFGGVRDWLIGCSVVLADGRLVRGGGRVVKNVSGYDMPKLFAGSWGTLGAIVEATFKLRPLPARDETLRIATQDFSAALRLGGQIARRVGGLQAVLALDGATAAAAGLPEQPALLVRAGGMEAVVHGALVAAIAVAADRESELAASDDALWQRLADVAVGPAAGSVALRIGCPPTALEAVAGMAASRFQEASYLAAVDGGLLSLRVAGPTAEAVRSLREAVSAQAGVLTVESVPAALLSRLDTWGADVPGLAIMRRIKAELDPKRTFSPGRFVGGL